MKILVIRRDNIGDLICTTPLLAGLRQKFPTAWIGVLANSYNAPVLQGNPDIDELFVYRKAKHRAGTSALSVYLERARMLWRLRRMKLDDVILAAPTQQKSAERFARWIKPKRILGGQDMAGQHEAEKVFAVLSSYGITGAPPACKVVPAPRQSERNRAALPAHWHGRPIAAIHISARKPSQRWPAEKFVELMRALHRRHGTAFLLFWSPGSATNALHPGDDEKAALIAAQCSDLPLLAMPTRELDELIAGIALTEVMICSDGGAMHIAAGLGKPIVCFFGQSSAQRWHPWGVPYRLLQPESANVNDISVDQAFTAYEQLLKL